MRGKLKPFLKEWDKPWKGTDDGLLFAEGAGGFWNVEQASITHCQQEEDSSQGLALKDLQSLCFYEQDSGRKVNIAFFLPKKNLLPKTHGMTHVL